MKSAPLKKSARLFALVPLLILAGCAGLIKTQETNPHADFCDIAKPFRFSRLLDTAETIEQAKEHNAIGAKLCGWGA